MLVCTNPAQSLTVGTQCHFSEAVHMNMAVPVMRGVFYKFFSKEIETVSYADNSMLLYTCACLGTPKVGLSLSEIFFLDLVGRRFCLHHSEYA